MAEIKTPILIKAKAFWGLMPNSQAAATPAQQPVVGKGTATNKTSAASPYLLYLL